MWDVGLLKNYDYDDYNISSSYNRDLFTMFVKKKLKNNLLCLIEFIIIIYNSFIGYIRQTFNLDKCLFATWDIALFIILLKMSIFDWFKEALQVSLNLILP